MKKVNLWKKGMAYLLVLGMAAGLAGCGQGGADASAGAGKGAEGSAADKSAEAEAGSLAQGLEPEEGAEIELAYWEGSTSDKAAWDELLENMRRDLPGIKITGQTYPSGQFPEMLDTRIGGDDWPDVIRYTYQKIGKFKEADVMLDLTPYITKENLDDLSPAFLSACQYNGKLVAMPHHADTMAVFYNKEMFEKSGVRIPTGVDDAWTWDEMTEIARKVKADNNLPYASGGIWAMNNGYRYLPFIYMAGGSLLNEDQTEVTINSPEALEGIKLYEDWRKEDLFSNGSITGDTTCNQLLAAGQIAFSFSGSWHCSYMDENMKGKWGVTYMPQKDGKTGSDMGGNSVFAYKGTKYPKAAAMVVEYITRAENMKHFCETGSFIPVRTSLLQEGAISYTNYAGEMKVFNDIVGTIDPKMAADETSVRFQQLNIIFGEEMDPLIVNGSKTAEEVAASCEEKMTEALQE